MRDYCIRTATPDDVDGARSVMLDTVYRDFGTGYVPRWHRDVIDLHGAYLAPVRHTLLVAVDQRDGTVAATAALDSRGPAHPPNPRHLAERYPSGETAQLRRVYVRPEDRRQGLARRLVGGLLDFAAADGGYRSAYLPAGWTGTVGLLPVTGYVVLLTLGQMLVAPAARARVPDLAEDGRLGLYTGALSSVSGLIVLAGSTATGSLLDTTLPPSVPWLVLAALPLTAITLLPRP